MGRARLTLALLRDLFRKLSHPPKHYSMVLEHLIMYTQQAGLQAQQRRS
jgi:hypothetical protein